MTLFIRIAMVLCLALSAGPAWAQIKTKDKGTAASAPTAAELVTLADDAYFGWDTAVDYEAAFGYYTQAAELGDAGAMNMLGRMYDNGDFVTADDTLEFDWTLQSAQAGLPVAMCNLGLLYANGEGTKQNYTQALTWYLAGVEEGESGCMLRAGLIYWYGNSVDIDNDKAHDLFIDALTAGNTAANWYLAYNYRFGFGVGVDLQRAADYGYAALISGDQTALTALLDEEAEFEPLFRSALQQLLAEGGFYDGGIDGQFGPQTKRALQAAFDSASSI